MSDTHHTNTHTATATRGKMMMASATVTTDADMNADNGEYSYGYKGKVAHRSWPQLPEEIVRLITTHFLWDLSANSHCPQTWENRRQWYSRMAYTCIRDTIELEKYVMSVCPEWRRAVETHLFWNQAINILDPNDVLLFHMVVHPKPPQNASSNAPSAPIYLTPYQHLRNILNSTCLVCRINYPLTNNGLANAKRLIANAFLGPVPICRDHERRRILFCGLCLRDTPVLHPQDTSSRDYELAQTLGIVENEDDETWPGVQATCRRCRAEWLWRKACANAEGASGPAHIHDAEALGGSPGMHSRDWETRQHIEGFVELGEGGIGDVLLLAREKYWLRHNTKFDSLGQHLLAAQRTSEPRMRERSVKKKGRGRRRSRGRERESKKVAGGGGGVDSPFDMDAHLRDPEDPRLAALDADEDQERQHAAAEEEEEEEEEEEADEEEEEEDDEDEDSEEDRELMLMRGAVQVRDLALQDWCRQRILDGHWISPADSWYGNSSLVPRAAWRKYERVVVGGVVVGGGAQGDSDGEEEGESGHGGQGQGQVVTVRTVHPCPWAREVDGVSTAAGAAGRSQPSANARSSSKADTDTTHTDTDPSGDADADPDADVDAPHPTESTLLGEVPPSFSLCEQAFVAHMKQMREILGPALRNVVRKVVLECSVPVYADADVEPENGTRAARKTDREDTTRKGGRNEPTRILGYEDPARIVAKMGIEDVLRVLREEEGVWYDGVDWLEKKRNEEEEQRERAARDDEIARREGREAPARRQDVLDFRDSTPSATSSPAASLASSAPSSASSSSAAAAPGVGRDHSHSHGHDKSSSSSASSSTGSVASGSKGSSSSGTSPVLSTTTLQTTPSPPPVLLPLPSDEKVTSDSGLDLDLGLDLKSERRLEESRWSSKNLDLKPSHDPESELGLESGSGSGSGSWTPAVAAQRPLSSSSSPTVSHSTSHSHPRSEISNSIPSADPSANPVVNANPTSTLERTPKAQTKTPETASKSQPTQQSDPTAPSDLKPENLTNPATNSPPTNPPTNADTNADSANNISLKRAHLLPSPRTIPIDPVRTPPRLLSKIPYVPVTTAHLPHYSLEALKAAWREASAPLFHCCCSVCERAKIAELNARAAAHGHHGALHPSIASPQPVQPTLRTTIYPPSARVGEIELKEIRGVDADAEGEGEEEIDYDASDLEYDEDEDEEYEEDFDDEEDGVNRQRQPYESIISYSDATPPSLPHRPASRTEPRAHPRKRSSDELLDDDDYDGAGVIAANTETGRKGPATEDEDNSIRGDISPSATLRKSGYRSQEGTPPKRARIRRGDEEDDRPRSLSSSATSDGDSEERERYQLHVKYEETARSPHHAQEESKPQLQSPGRHRKRNSEELDDADADVHVPPHHQGKRVRTASEDVGGGDRVGVGVVGSGTRLSPLLVASPDEEIWSSSSPSAAQGVSLMHGVLREANEKPHR